MIISIEDAILHPGMAVASWIMMATGKGWNPPAAAVDFILNMSYELAAVELRDPVSNMEDLIDEKALPDLLKCRENGLSEEECMLVRAITVRACYGGMTGDMVMLKKAAANWLQRFSDKEKGVSRVRWIEDLKGIYMRVSRPLESKHLVSTVSLAPLLNGDCPRSAVDFHVSNLVPELRLNDSLEREMRGAAPRAEILDDLLRDVIWTFKSCLSKKEELPVSPKLLESVRLARDREEERKDGLKALWAVIEAHVEAYQNKRIRQAYELMP